MLSDSGRKVPRRKNKAYVIECRIITTTLYHIFLLHQKISTAFDASYEEHWWRRKLATYDRLEYKKSTMRSVKKAKREAAELEVRLQQESRETCVIGWGRMIAHFKLMHTLTDLKGSKLMARMRKARRRKEGGGGRKAAKEEEKEGEVSPGGGEPSSPGGSSPGGKEGDDENRKGEGGEEEGDNDSELFLSILWCTVKVLRRLHRIRQRKRAALILTKTLRSMQEDSKMKQVVGACRSRPGRRGSKR